MRGSKSPACSVHSAKHEFPSPCATPPKRGPMQRHSTRRTGTMPPAPHKQESMAVCARTLGGQQPRRSPRPAQGLNLDLPRTKGVASWLLRLAEVPCRVYRSNQAQQLMNAAVNRTHVIICAELCTHICTQLSAPVCTQPCTTSKTGVLPCRAVPKGAYFAETLSGKTNKPPLALPCQPVPSFTLYSPRQGNSPRQGKKGPCEVCGRRCARSSATKECPTGS